MEYLLTPFQLDVLEKLLVRIIVFATEIAITQRFLLLHNPLRVEEASQQILLFMQAATPA